jgi:phage shock protein E
MKLVMWVIALVAVVALTRAVAGPSQAVRARTKDLPAGGALILDVRTAGEYAGGHYPGATNIPVQKLAERIKELGATNRSIVVYCRSGARSAAAEKILRKAGFTDVVNAGGLRDMPKP